MSAPSTSLAQHTPARAALVYEFTLAREMLAQKRRRYFEAVDELLKAPDDPAAQSGVRYARTLRTHARYDYHEARAALLWFDVRRTLGSPFRRVRALFSTSLRSA